MALRIFKYPIEGGNVVVDGHKGMRPLTVQLQHGVPTLWALVDDAQPKMRSWCYEIPTGGELPNWGEQGHLDEWTASQSYVGTILFGSGLVFHYFFYRSPTP